jgi:hypothetical protein
MKFPQGWKWPFDNPIPLARGRQLVTLEDAGAYITKLPKTVHMAPGVAGCDGSVNPGGDVGGPTMFARIGVMRGLNRNVERVIDPSRKDHHWGWRKRDE